MISKPFNTATPLGTHNLVQLPHVPSHSVPVFSITSPTTTQSTDSSSRLEAFQFEDSAKEAQSSFSTFYSPSNSPTTDKWGNEILTPVFGKSLKEISDLDGPISIPPMPVYHAVTSFHERKISALTKPGEDIKRPTPLKTVDQLGSVQVLQGKQPVRSVATRPPLDPSCDEASAFDISSLSTSGDGEETEREAYAESVEEEKEDLPEDELYVARKARVTSADLSRFSHILPRASSRFSSDILEEVDRTDANLAEMLRPARDSMLAPIPEHEKVEGLAPKSFQELVARFNGSC